MRGTKFSAVARKLPLQRKHRVLLNSRAQGGRVDAEIALFGRADRRVRKEAEAGLPVADLLRRRGISRSTYFLGDRSTWARPRGAAAHQGARRRPPGDTSSRQRS